MKKLLVVLVLLVLVEGLAFAQGTYYVSYYANNTGPVCQDGEGEGLCLQQTLSQPQPLPPQFGAFDQIIRIINVGTLGTPLTSPVGDICANIYVFDADQEMAACCSLRLTPNELDSAYVFRQLTNNPLTSVVPPSGVVKIVLVPPPTGGCDPTVSTTAPDAGLGVVFATHLQREPPDNPFAPLFVTETQKQASLLSVAEENFLQTSCTWTRYLGSGQGTCTGTVSSGQF